jgi:hypothetical protein
MRFGDCHVHAASFETGRRISSERVRFCVRAAHQAPKELTLRPRLTVMIGPTRGPAMTTAWRPLGPPSPRKGSSLIH